jgi:hypothetical protein
MTRLVTEESSVRCGYVAICHGALLGTYKERQRRDRVLIFSP